MSSQTIGRQKSMAEHLICGGTTYVPEVIGEIVIGVILKSVYLIVLHVSSLIWSVCLLTNLFIFSFS